MVLPRKVTLIFAFSFFLLLITSVSNAEESRIIGGEGLLSDNSELISSIWRIGLCEIIPNDEFGFEVADMAYSVWPGAFAESGAFTTVRMDTMNPSTMTAADIINVGQEYNVDALICGVINQAKFRQVLWGNNYEVRVEIAFQLYETTTGTLLWERTLKKDRTVNLTEAGELIRRFAGNVGTDSVLTIIADGITGRDITNNEPPQIHCSLSNIEFATASIMLTGSVTDDFGLTTLTVQCGEGTEPLLTQSCESESTVDFTLLLKWDSLEDTQLIIEAIDSQGLNSELTLPIDDDEPFITGTIANISSDMVFINIGSVDGVEDGMTFIVQSEVDIIDPSTGENLGTTVLEVGVIQVDTADAEFSTCSIIEGEVENMSVGDSVY